LRPTGPTTRCLRAAAVVLLLTIAVAACAREGKEQKRADGYNVLLITLDTTRADRIGAYGYRDAVTPAIDSIAARGVLFSAAGSAVPLTLPSHATILSGLLPQNHGLRNNGSGVFPADAPTLASVLSAKGYRTGAFVGAFVLDRRFGLNRGFDQYDDLIERNPTSGMEAERNGETDVRIVHDFVRSRRRCAPAR
jgi:arylsulfatase A-like enzyme